ncbi:heavy metal translocating P-type ATPase [bacterium]|nr:heavy metal translocating P-type ATPase [bacterium]
METQKFSFKVLGMTCASCSRINERNLLAVPGVQYASINLGTNTAFVIAESTVTMADLEKAVIKGGYRVSLEMDDTAEKKRFQQTKVNWLVSVIALLPLATLMVFHMLKRLPPFLHSSYPWIEIVLSTFIIFYTGRKTIRGAWIALTHSHTNMDTLIFLGAFTAWVTSVLHLLSMLHILSLDLLSFGAIGAMIVTLHLTGRFIESWLRDRASREIKALLNVQSREARLITAEGEFMIPIAMLKPNQAVLVKPGERFPADGEVLEGSGSVDESMISGEPIPVLKRLKDTITGGSLNITSPIKVNVTKVGEDTFLSQMIQLIQEAQGSKVPIQAFADLITLWFVPIIAALAFISGIVWYFFYPSLSPFLDNVRPYLPWILKTDSPLSFALFAFVSTMVIACPCALGLATPMALIAGTGLAAKKGLIIRNAEAIQTSKDIDIVLLDKTGTLTKGQPVVVQHTLDAEMKDLVASMESLSTHPLAKAVSFITETRLPGITIEETMGEGVRTTWQNHRYFIGKPKHPDDYSTFYQLGQTVVEVLKDEVKAGYIVIEDPLREDSKQGIATLLKMGVTPVMVTGDQEATARIVAERVGIEQVFANTKPGQKLTILDSFRSQGKKIMMVGDGMNDAASLKGSDIGVSIGSGTDLAIDNSDIIIVQGGISKVVDVIHIARTTFKVIRQNLFWAFIYNLVAIPLAMMGFLHPAIAESAMALSSITVVFNSLRIKNEAQRTSH